MPPERRLSISDQSSVRICGIEPDGRLVEQDQPGAVDEAARQQQAPAHPAGELVDLVAAPLGEPGEREAAVHRVAHVGHAIEAREHGEVVLDRHVDVEVVELRDDAHLGPRLLRLVRQHVAEHPDRALVRQGLAGKHAHRGRLPGTVGPEQAETCPLGDVEIEPVHRGDLTEALDDSSELDCGHPPEGTHVGARQSWTFLTGGRKTRPELWTRVQRRSVAARIPFSSPGTTQEDQSRHAQDSSAQRHRRPVEPQRRGARLRRPDAARQLPVRGQRVLRGGAAHAAAQGHLQAPAADARAGRAARPDAGRRRRPGDEGVGARERRDPLHARLPAAHGPHRREARLVLRAGGRRPRARRVLGQGADPGRAGRILVPDRRRAGDLRGARLHRLGPDEPGVHPREPQRRAALHPDGVRLLDG